MSNLAVLYQLQGRFGEAEPLQRRLVKAYERVLGPNYPDTLTNVDNLAFLYFKQADWNRAIDFWRRSTAARAQRDRIDNGLAVTGKKRSEAEQLRWQFTNLVKAIHRFTLKGSGPDAAARETFQTAQWAVGSEAAQAMAQMAARGTKGDPALALLVRDRQDLVAEWQKLDALRNAALALAPDKRKAKVEGENSARLGAIEARIAEIDKELAAKFPDYVALASPAPVALEEARALLGANEALILFLDTPEAKPTPEETFIWVVTRTDMRWVRSDLGSATLTREVKALRCGLDAVAWIDGECLDLTGQVYTTADMAAGKVLPFDYARAHKLYKALFGQVEDLINGKHLLIVPSGALTLLPFQALATRLPAARGGDKNAAWLIRDHALTVLPAVSSLKALRRVARPSAANRPMIGFGNPLLDGDPADATDRSRAQAAREKQRCPETIWRRVASLFGLRRGVVQI